MNNWFFKFAWSVMRPVSHILFRLQIEGTEHLPAHGAMLCANHSSNWDPVLIAIALPMDYGLRAMAKDSLFRFPPLRWVVEHLGAFPVARGHSDINSVKTAMKAIRDGENLLIFPEGTRVKDPGHAEVKGGAAMMAIRSGVDMVPVFIDTRKRPFHRVHIVIGRPYTPVYTGRKGTAEEYQANADEIMRRAYALGGIVCR